MKQISEKLFHAILQNKLDGVQLALSEDVDINQKHPQHGTPLHCAASKGVCDIISYLLDHNADVNAVTTAYGSTPLYVACREGQVDTVTLLLESKASSHINAIDGCTPMHIAVQTRKNRLDVTRILVEHSADINARSNAGITPIYEAVSQSCHHLVKYLLLHKADIDIETKTHRTLLSMACKVSSNDKIPRLLLDARANVDIISTNSGNTALFDLTSIPDRKIAHTLLSYKANPVHMNHSQRTPLSHALTTPSSAVWLTFLPFMTDICAPVYNDLNVLMFACQSNNSNELVPIVLQHILNVYSKNSKSVDTKILK